jgi:hypothetical protein
MNKNELLFVADWGELKIIEEGRDMKNEKEWKIYREKRETNELVKVSSCNAKATKWSSSRSYRKGDETIQKELEEVRALGLTKTTKSLLNREGVSREKRLSAAEKELQEIRALGLAKIHSSKTFCSGQEKGDSEKIENLAHTSKELDQIMSSRLTVAFKSTSQIKDESIDDQNKKEVDEAQNVCLTESEEDTEHSRFSYYEIEFGKCGANAIAQVVKKHTSENNLVSSRGLETISDPVEGKDEMINNIIVNQARIERIKMSGLKRIFLKKKKQNLHSSSE